MTTDNKTLADVHPGGRVRLGDPRRQWLEIRGLASAIVKNLESFAASPHKAAWCGALDDSLTFADQIEKDAAAAYESILAARQPVGEPVAYTSEAQLNAVRVSGDGIMSQRNAKWRIPLYTAPPAQAVDLGAVREALQAAEGLATICASVDGYSREEVAASGRAMRQQFADALAKVDSQAGK